MIPIYAPEISEVDIEAVTKTVSTGWVSSQAPIVIEFERFFAKAHEKKYAVAVSNCTVALHLVLEALDVGAGDEVLVPCLSFIAPANMVLAAGATPVLVDVGTDDWNLCPVRAREAITPKTKAMVIVHGFGCPAKLDLLLELAKEFDLKVIEDNAEAPFSRFGGRLTGTFGDASCYSFFANKIFTSGEGGMILTDNGELEHRLRLLRDHGMNRAVRYQFDVLGYNYRMTAMQAALGLSQVSRMRATLERRWAQHIAYTSRLQNVPGLAMRPFPEGVEPVHWLFTVSLRDHLTGRRDEIIAAMLNAGIECRPMVPPISRCLHFSKMEHVTSCDFPVSNSISFDSFHLPSSCGLDEQNIGRICGNLIACIEALDV